MLRSTTVGRLRPARCRAAASFLIALIASAPLLARQEEGGSSWLETELAREVETAVASAPFRLSDSIGGRAPATLGAKSFDDGESIHSFELSFGADQAARCYLWETELSVAGLLDRQTQQVQAGLGENTQWRVFGFDADVAGGVPLLGVRWLYQIETEERTNIGLFKMYAAAPGAVTLLCFHDRLGYVESFGSLFRALVADLDAPSSDEAPPDARDVSIVSMFDMKVGFVEDSISFDGEQVQVVSESALLVPTSASEILSSDEASVERSTLDGHLISAVVAEGPGLEVSTRLEVERQEDGGWLVSGIRAGQDFEARFTGDPMSNYGTILMARQARSNPDTPLTFSRWDDNEPGQISTAVITILDAGPPTRAKMSMQGIDAEAILDSEGRASTILMTTDGVDIAMVRVLEEGTLPVPKGDGTPPD